MDCVSDSSEYDAMPETSKNSHRYSITPPHKKSQKSKLSHVRKILGDSSKMMYGLASTIEEAEFAHEAKDSCGIAKIYKLRQE